jgi:hypothetical protein
MKEAKGKLFHVYKLTKSRIASSKESSQRLASTSCLGVKDNGSVESSWMTTAPSIVGSGGRMGRGNPIISVLACGICQSFQLVFSSPEFVVEETVSYSRQTPGVVNLQRRDSSKAFASSRYNNLRPQTGFDCVMTGLGGRNRVGINGFRNGGVSSTPSKAANYAKDLKRDDLPFILLSTKYQDPVISSRFHGLKIGGVVIF